MRCLENTVNLSQKLLHPMRGGVPEKKSGWENLVWERPRYKTTALKTEECKEGTEEKKEARKKSRREKRKKGDWEGLRWVRKGAKVVVENEYKKRTNNQVDQSTQTIWCQPYVEDCPEPDQTNGSGPIPTRSQSHTPQTGPGDLTVQERVASENTTWNRVENVQPDAPEGGNTQW